MSAMEISESPPYQLAASHAGHEQDVRTVGSLDDGTIISGSRDATVRLWRRAEDGSEYTCMSTLNAHTHYVQRICATASGLASCSNDRHIIEWDVSAGVPARILEGHADVVSCVATSVSSGLLYSASWDKTARVWKDGTCVRELKGHEAALWCVPMPKIVMFSLSPSPSPSEPCPHSCGHAGLTKVRAATRGDGRSRLDCFWRSYDQAVERHGVCAHIQWAFRCCQVPRVGSGRRLPVFIE